ncbi:peroxisome membrane protein [Phycomyces nitens]|nr:peroxisome membrane protein [Phycomyces nitens]
MLPLTLLRFKTNRPYTLEYASRIESVEDFIRAASLLLPGRFEDAELCSQTILSILNLFSLHHTKLLVRAASSKFQLDTRDKPGQPRLAFNRNIEEQYTRWATRTVAMSLSVLSYTEVVLEMLIRRRCSRQGQWRWLSFLEGLKAVLRLYLFFRTKQRMVLHPTHLVRNIDPSTLEASSTDKFELTTLDPRVGTPSTSNPDLIHSKDAAVTRPRRGWAVVGEIVWILRPLVYVLLVMREQSKNKGITKEEEEEREEGEEEDEEEKSGWVSWVVSLGLDLLARTATRQQTMTPLEKDERRRRDYLLLYYFLRKPFYTTFTQPVLDSFCNQTEHRPIVSILAAAVNDYRPFWETIYFYTAGS